MKRCYICDYTPEEGSDFADRAPFTGLVHDHDGNFLCDQCADVSEENLYDLVLDDDVED